MPLLTVRVFWEPDVDDHKVIGALQELADEDPLLDAQWLQDERELHIKVMGPIQLEILNSVLEERYALKVTFGQPSVIYKETPARAGKVLSLTRCRNRAGRFYAFRLSRDLRAVV